ncbi:MAG: FHA domain-containing protein [Labilithrix sp.]|nr:FHA domain-containing protein [Labilithrix sp.]MCW5810461.1 FHA domain-containing protein [Labilithrix sp.]
MPVTVTVRREESSGESPSLTFDGPRVVIGRSDGADVRLPDPSVSLRHASVRAEGTGFAVVDEGSTNGTWVGGVRLPPHTPRLVKTGDLVRVGRVWLELAIGQRAATPDLGAATRDLALALVRQAMEAHGEDTRVKVRVAEGPDLGAELVLAEDGKSYLAGRAERCDLPLADEDASREHAAITRRGGQVWVRDLRSSNGVYLGEQRIASDRDVPWRGPNMLRIGASVLALDEPVSVALADLASLEDEKLPPDAEPPPPSSLAGPPSPPAVAAPPSAAPAAAIAELPKGPDSRAAVTVRRPRRRTWGLVDVLVVGVAVAIIGASLAGLVWVLK